MKNIIILEDDMGCKKEYYLLSSFETIDNKKYIIYTENEKDEEGFIKVYAGKKVDNNLISIKSSKEWEIIESFLNKLDKECEE